MLEDNEFWVKEKQYFPHLRVISMTPNKSKFHKKRFFSLEKVV